MIRALFRNHAGALPVIGVSESMRYRIRAGLLYGVGLATGSRGLQATGKAQSFR
jgi:hypothetical protein